MENNQTEQEHITNFSELSTVPPPIGVVPQYIWREKSLYERLKDIDDCIRRYLPTEYPINPKWIEERDEIIKTLQSSGVYFNSRRL